MGPESFPGSQIMSFDHQTCLEEIFNWSLIAWKIGFGCDFGVPLKLGVLDFEIGI